MFKKKKSCKIHFGLLFDEDIPLTQRLLYLALPEDKKREAEELYKVYKEDIKKLKELKFNAN